MGYTFSPDTTLGGVSRGHLHRVHRGSRDLRFSFSLRGVSPRPPSHKGPQTRVATEDPGRVSCDRPPDPEDYYGTPPTLTVRDGGLGTLYTLEARVSDHLNPEWWSPLSVTHGRRVPMGSSFHPLLPHQWSLV